MVVRVVMAQVHALPATINFTCKMVFVFHVRMDNTIILLFKNAKLAIICVLLVMDLIAITVQVAVLDSF